MTKELIRNGGFERGNLDFWKCYMGTVDVVDDVKKRGSYSAKLSAGAINVVQLGSKDYIEIVPYALYKCTGWYKNVSLDKMLVSVMFFDSDINHVGGGDITIWEKTGTFDWTFSDAWFTAPLEASYLVLVIAGTGTNGTYGYADSISLQSVDLDKLTVNTKELVKVTNLTSTGTFYSDEFFSGLWKYGEFYLNVSSLTGTSPTLDVTIQAYDPTTGIWKDIVKFDQSTSSGSQLKVATAGLGWQLRVKYTTGGTITDCDFIVSVIFKR